MSDSVQPHRQQPTRLPRPWDSPGKNTGVGCHFLLQCMKVKSESEIAQSCPSLSDPIDCSPPAPPSMGFFQARVLEWGAIAFSEAIIVWKVYSSQQHSILVVKISGERLQICYVQNTMIGRILCWYQRNRIEEV